MTTRKQMYLARDRYTGHNRRKLTSDSSFLKTLRKRDTSPSVSGCSRLVAATVAMSVITGDGIKKVDHGDLGCTKKRSRFSKLFRSGAISCQYLALIFLLAGTPSIVQAQAQAQLQNDTAVVPPASSNVIVPESTPLPDSTPSENAFETIGPLPTIATGPPAPSSVSGPLSVAPSPPPTPVVTTGTPSKRPTIAPTLGPTLRPTRSAMPSEPPTVTPSSAPSVSPAPTVTPSSPPSGQPSSEVASLKDTKFRQEFQVGNGRQFNEEEIILFQTFYQRYTIDFSPLPESEVTSKIASSCTVDRQEILIENSERQLEYDSGTYETPDLQRWRGRRLEDTPSNPNVKTTLNVDYTMKYESRYYNVTLYPKLFQNWTNSNLNVLLEQMQFLNINVTNVESAKRIVVSTPAPSASTVPSITPSSHPTITPGPTPATRMPISVPGSVLPTITDEVPGVNKSLAITMISIAVALALVILIIGLYFYFKNRRTDRLQNFRAKTSKNSESHVPSQPQSSMSWAGGTKTTQAPSQGTSETKAFYGSPSYGKYPDVPSRLADSVSSPPPSVVSSQSLISRGNSMGGDSRDESDSAHVLVDEFDQYKDQNLEKMRADIEHLPACDGMMSQAVAKALIDQDDELNISDSYWGGDSGITASEIEASALGFVLDWLKRNGKVSDRERREMMQEQLNKMTASVLNKIIGPDDATQIIHECAVLLGLKLASDLSATTILISGMRKKATEADIRRTFSVFGDIAVAAVSPIGRGFGILRFKSNNAVNRAMSKFRIEEVVVEDVAVQLIVIKSNTGDMEENVAPKII